MLSVNIESKMFGDRDRSDITIGSLKIKVEDGETVSLLGPSGAGKTTLLRIVAGLDRDFHGCVRLDGEVIVKPSASIQVVFQDGRLLPWKSVLANLQFSNLRGLEELSLLQLLEEFGLGRRVHAWPKILSGGERSRLALARIFVANPRVLLLDEPFRNLDIVTSWRAQEVVTDYIKRERIATLLVSHSIGDAIAMGDRVVVLGSAPMEVVGEWQVDRLGTKDRGGVAFQALVSELSDVLRRDSRIRPSMGA